MCSSSHISSSRFFQVLFISFRQNVAANQEEEEEEEEEAEEVESNFEPGYNELFSPAAPASRSLFVATKAETECSLSARDWHTSEHRICVAAWLT